MATNKKKLMFVLHMSKTHWKNHHPQIIKIKATEMIHEKVKKKDENNSTLYSCLYQALRDYVAFRASYRSYEEPFFVFSDGSSVSPSQFVKTLTKTLKLNSLNSELYCSHSFRIGRSCDLLKMGIPVETIKKLGRWKSNCIYSYLKY